MRDVLHDLRDPRLFRAALLRVPSNERDAWADTVLGIEEVPDDGVDLPRGCVPYLPSSVEVLLRVVDAARVCASDVFVDVGAGIGRASALVHLLTGASVIGLEVQAMLVAAANNLAQSLGLPRVSFVHGDAGDLTSVADVGTVFFLYCPFSGERLARALARLEVTSRARALRVCTVDLPLPSCSWLTRVERSGPGDVAIYRSGSR